MKRKSVFIFVSILFLVVTAAIAQADMVKVYFNVATRVQVNPQTKVTETQLDIQVVPVDNSSSNPPDYVASIVVKAPNGDSANMTTKDNWEPYVKRYRMRVPSAAFTGGVIPTGTYKVSVTDTSSITITSTDVISSATFINPATIIQPAEGSVVTDGEFIIKWSVVPGAKQYAVGLWDKTQNMPVFMYHLNPLHPEMVFTQRNFYKLPKGAINPNRSYKVLIVSFNDLLDWDKNSSSDWINFSTGAW